MESLPARSLLEPGYRIDRYELLCALATGGMGAVWVARMRGRHGFEKLFAIKTIRPECARDPRFRTMFMDEARIASLLEHPEVVQILDLGEQDGMLYLVMEYVDGDSLHKLYRACEATGTLLPPGLVLRVLADACRGLHAAHELRDKEGRPLEVVHRDVSPQNVLLGVNGAVKVIDFGIAKARGRLSEETNTGGLKGRVRYMAPEQALGQKVDRRADVWAIGAVAYHLLRGRSPYDGDDVSLLRGLIAREPIEPLGRAVHPAIATVVHTALQYDCNARFESARALGEAFEQAMIAAQLTCSRDDIGAACLRLAGASAEARRAAVSQGVSAVDARNVARIMLEQPLSTATGSDARMGGFEPANPLAMVVHGPHGARSATPPDEPPTIITQAPARDDDQSAIGIEAWAGASRKSRAPFIALGVGALLGVGAASTLLLYANSTEKPGATSLTQANDLGSGHTVASAASAAPPPATVDVPDANASESVRATADAPATSAASDASASSASAAARAPTSAAVAATSSTTARGDRAAKGARRAGAHSNHDSAKEEDDLGSALDDRK
jgi:serine/threonine-protein kinase